MSYNLVLTKQIIYRLKRNYGVAVRLVQVGDATVNYQTGVSTPSYTILNLDRVVKMPASMLRTYATSFQGMAGGAVDFSKSVFILDINDLPSTVDIDLNDYIEFESKKWQISLVMKSDDRQVYFLQVEAVENATPEPIRSNSQGIGLTQEIVLEYISLGDAE